MQGREQTSFNCYIYVEATGELVDHDHPRLYQAFNYEDYKETQS